MSRFVVAALLLHSLVAPAFAQEESKTWEGTWTNRRFNTTGPLKCVATPEEGGTWKATFTGKFQGRPFSYDVTFQSRPAKGQEMLSGKATVSGYKYEWTGTMKGNALTGRYKANNGYNGDFVLKAPARK